LLDAFVVSHCLCSARRYLHSDLRGDTVTTNIKPQTPAGEAIVNIQPRL